MKDGQCAIPMVCPPESATKSVMLRFLLAKSAMSWSALANGGGKLFNVVFWLANASESRRPSGTA